MKKLMFALATAAALVGMADIESANTVGYTTKTVEADKYYLIGVQFNETGSGEEKIDMNSLISLSSELVPGTYEDDFVGAPMIQVLSPKGGYDLYFYISDATDDNDDPLGYNCWADNEGYALKDVNKLELGKGFWFKASQAGTVVVKGEVSNGSEKVVPFPADSFYIMSNPFPTPFSLSDVVTTGVNPGTYEDDFVGAPMIQVLSSKGGYDLYFYISDATDENDDAVGYDCWADNEGYILKGNQVDAGASFWIKASQAGSIGFSF